MVGMGVVFAVHRYPANGIGLQRERSKDRKEVFDWFEESKAAMRQDAMKAERNPQRHGRIRYDPCGRQRRPTEKTGPEGRERSNVDADEAKTFDSAISLMHIWLVERSYCRQTFKWN